MLEYDRLLCPHIRLSILSHSITVKYYRRSCKPSGVQSRRVARYRSGGYRQTNFERYLIFDLFRHNQGRLVALDIVRR